MDLLPVDIGPLNPPVAELVVAAVLFAFVLLFFVRLVPRIQRVLDDREAATRGAEALAEAVREEAERKQADAAATLAEARHDAARIRQRAFEEGAALIAAARADGQAQYTTILTEGHARITADRTRAEPELRIYASELASNLASRVIGERIEAKPQPQPRP
jgi:F-type H+-transporting ATPase subunit b